MMAKLTGFDKVMKNLNKEIAKIEGVCLSGLIKAAVVIRNDMDKTPPLIPINTGNLRASWFVVTRNSTESDPPNFEGDDAPKLDSQYGSVTGTSKMYLNKLNVPAIVLGFTAHYAWYVHEMVGANFAGPAHKIKYTGSGKITPDTLKYTRRAGAGAKFFESSLKRNSGKIIEIIKRDAGLR
jgi:hypothetical protein